MLRKILTVTAGVTLLLLCVAIKYYVLDPSTLVECVSSAFGLFGIYFAIFGCLMASGKKKQ